MFDEQIEKMGKYIKSLSHQEVWKLIDQSFGMWKWEIDYYFNDNNYTWSFSDSTM